MIRPGVTGIILAGGESRRMGSLKPLVPYRGKPLIHWIYDALAPLCNEMIIIANAGDYSDLAAFVYPDNFPGNGPAAGIEAGLSHCSTGQALISSCDTPNLSTGFFRYLLENHSDFDISIAFHDGINEPLAGVYNRSVHPFFREAIISGDPHPPRIIRQCRWQEVKVYPGLNFYQPDLFLNLNSPSDLIKHKMARIKLIYFGSVTDISGMTEETADVPSTLNELDDYLKERFPGLTDIRYRLSVNRKLAEGDCVLHDGDEVALLPPFAGG
jgi:molybdenum cofactor guanylyltransferase